MRITLALIISLTILPYMSETIYTPALPAIVKDLNSSAHAVEATLAVYFLGFAIGVFTWGAVSDIIGRRKTMLIGLIIYLISCLGCCFSLSIESLMLFRITQAFGVSVGSVISQTILRDLFDGKKRAQVFSILSGALAFSPALGPVIGGALSDYFGWQYNFWFLSILASILWILALLRLPETKPEHIQGRRGMGSLVWSMLSSKNLLGHTLLISATNGIIFGFYGEAPFIFIEKFHMTATQYGWLGIIISLATLVSAKLSYSLGKKYDSERIIKLGTSIALLGSCIMLAFLINPKTENLWGVIISLFAVFLGTGLIIPNALSLALKDYSDRLGVAGSIFGTAYYILIALSTWGISILHNGTSWLLPSYLLGLSLVLRIGYSLIQRKELYSLNCR